MRIQLLTSHLRTEHHHVRRYRVAFVAPYYMGPSVRHTCLPPFDAYPHGPGPRRRCSRRAYTDDLAAITPESIIGPCMCRYANTSDIGVDALSNYPLVSAGMSGLNAPDSIWNSTSPSSDTPYRSRLPISDAFRASSSIPRRVRGRSVRTVR